MPAPPATLGLSPLSERILRDGEALFGLAPAVKPYGVHPATALRWCSRGCKAKSGTLVRLEHIRCGSRIKTSAEAVKRFFAALTGDDQGGAESPPAPTASERRKAAEAANRELEKLGA